MRNRLVRPINVLHFICPTGYYGAERWIVALAKNLDKADVRCDLVTTVGLGNTEAGLVENFPTDQGEVFRLRSDSRFDFSLIGKIEKLISDRNIEVLHTHGYKSDILGLVAAKRRGIACISTPHGFGKLSNHKIKFYVGAGLKALKFFDKVVPLSVELLEEFQRRRFSEDRLRYIANGVDTSEIDAYLHQNQRPNSEHQPTVITVGYTGRLAHGKGVDQIIRAFQKVQTKNKHTKLMLVGEGPLRCDLEALVKRLGCDASITFTGFQPRRFDYLSQFDIFVMASESEGIPRSMMEAMAMGKAVVAYDIPGVDLLVEHESTGLLADYGNHQKLAESIERLIEDKALRMTLAKAGQTHVQNRYSGKRMAVEYSQLYREVLT